MYTQEQYDSLPDWMQKDLVKDGEVYKHAGFMKVKQTADNLDGEKRTLAEKLAAFEAAEAAKIAEAEKKAYEKAKAEGNKEELERILNQKIEDADRRANESEAKFKERMQNLANKQRDALTQELANKFAVKGAENAYKKLIASLVSVDPETDSLTFFDDAGSATSLDRAGFEEFLKTHPDLEHLTKADIHTNGGGKANGSGNNSSSAVKNPWKRETLNLTEQARILRESPQLASTLKSQAEA